MSEPGITRKIESYLYTHYGYGNPHAKFWLIGMEEGGGGTREEILRRIEIWHELGAREVTDVVEFHNRLGMPEFFRDPVKYQRTWAHLIRLLLSVSDQPTDSASVKTYQRDRLGRHNGENCLLELLPLPSPGTSVWNYGEWTGLPYLKDRDTYQMACIPWRTAHLREMIEQYRPQVVVFYGLKYRPYYEQIAGSPFTRETSGFEYTQDEYGLYTLVKHPAAYADGANAAYFEGIGQAIRSKLGSSALVPPADAAEQPADVAPYGLYRCGCGKMLMGYDLQNHITQAHNGRNIGLTRVR